MTKETRSHLNQNNTWEQQPDDHQSVAAVAVRRGRKLTINNEQRTINNQLVGF
jgi:hypothetical protein